MPSEPYPPLDPAPADFTLATALKATHTPDGHYHCGKLEFATKADYQSFKQAQTELAKGATAQQQADQLSVLHTMETTGKPPWMDQKINPAPAGTTIDGLLDLKGQKPDSNGMYHVGSLQVSQADWPQFEAVQRDIAGKNPEALSMLYHMENAQTPPDLTFKVTDNSDRNDRFEPDANTIYFNPNTAVKDQFNGARVPPATAALHEETHWAGRRIGDITANIPAGQLDNWEEGRVIEGVESRDMALRGLPQRHSHFGSVINVKGLDSITPSMDVQQNGVGRTVTAPFSQSGKILESKDGWTTISTRGDGATAAHQMKVNTEELSIMMGGDQNAAKLTADAIAHKDQVTIKLANDGTMSYENPAQQARLKTTPIPGVEFPTQAVVAHEGVVHTEHAAHAAHTMVGGR